jgi:hypothetical protein
MAAVRLLRALPTDATVPDRLLIELGWQIRPTNPARRLLASALATLERLGQQDALVLLKPYAAAAHELAQTEVQLALDREGLDQRAEAVVIIGVLGDAILSALRMLAQEDVTTRTLNPPNRPPDGDIN